MNCVPIKLVLQGVSIVVKLVLKLTPTITVLINHARFTSECYNVWQTKLNIITMNNQRQSRSQLDTTKIAQINKSPSALNQFLNFCDKNKVDIAMITEPPIRKGVPNISRKFKPLYATNHYSSDHHPNTHQQNQLHVSVPNVQLPSSFQPYVQQVSAMQHVPSAGLEPINHSISNHRSASINQQASVNQPNTNNQQVSSVLQPPLNQQPSNNPPSSTTPTPVRSCIIIFNPSLSPITISSVSNTDFITIEINNFVFASVYSQPVGSIESTIECLNSLVNYASSKKLVITGDLNAKSLYWGPTIINS